MAEKQHRFQNIKYNRTELLNMLYYIIEQNY